MAYTFLRWLRTGLAASLGDDPRATGSARRPTLPIGVDVGGSGLQSQVATVGLEVLGPGDVSGLDRRQVIRTFPVPGTLDFDTAYHAHAELDRPDLPWLFTPFGPSSAGTLRPWICLVVLEVGEHTVLTPGVPLPLLSVTGSEVAALPAPDDLHRWAHVQVTGSATGIEAITQQEPERILSRLVCPRVLRSDTAYLACIVPTFRIGALAGLGRPIPDILPLDAWAAGDARVELPVYHHWEFTTGRDGNFRSLVLRLEPRPIPAQVGTRALDVTTPGFGLPDRAATTRVPLGGALRVVPAAVAPVDATLATELEGVVNVDRAVSPPIYGRWHAAVTAVHAAAAPPGWVQALNLDPRYRVAAALGTQVVQERQEDLMAAVWEQFGEILRANTLLRQGQLAVAAAERVVARHLTPLSDAALLLVAGPAAGRIRTSRQLTLRGAANASCLPVLALSGAFRRVTRPRGALERRLGRLERTRFPDGALPPLPSSALDPSALVVAMASGALAGPQPRLPDGAVAMPSGRGRRGGPLDELRKTFAVLAGRSAASSCTPLDVSAVAGTLRAAIVPDIAVAGRVRAQVAIPPGGRVRLSQRLDPIMAAPEIPTPMIGPLLELGQDWLLPGIGDLPANTVAIVEADAAFIASYMVGLNHEMARELLWRGFPTDQRGTVFSRFWDRRGAVSTVAAPAPDRDMVDIHEWDTLAELGADLLGSGAEALVVLLVRGDLLQRYPRATIYLQRGRWQRTQGAIRHNGDLALREPVPLGNPASWEADARFPQFGGRVGADVMFVGFPLPKAAVKGMGVRDVPARATDDEAGWYVVFEEQPTEPRFGRPPSAPAPPFAAASAELAAQLLRPAFRLSVHADDLIGP